MPSSHLYTQNAGAGLGAAFASFTLLRPFLGTSMQGNVLNGVLSALFAATSCQVVDNVRIRGQHFYLSELSYSRIKLIVGSLNEADIRGAQELLKAHSRYQELVIGAGVDKDTSPTFAEHSTEEFSMGVALTLLDIARRAPQAECAAMFRQIDLAQAVFKQVIYKTFTRSPSSSEIASQNPVHLEAAFGKLVRSEKINTCEPAIIYQETLTNAAPRGATEIMGVLCAKFGSANLSLFFQYDTSNNLFRYFHPVEGFYKFDQPEDLFWGLRTSSRFFAPEGTLRFIVIQQQSSLV